MSDKVLILPAQLIKMIYDERQTPFPPSWKREIYEFVDTISVAGDHTKGLLIIKRDGDCSWWGIAYPLAQAARPPWEPAEMGGDDPDLDLELHLMVRQEKVTYVWREA